MNAGPLLVALLLLAGVAAGLGAGLAGCARGRRPAGPELRHGSGLPDPEVVTSAVTRLTERVREELADEHGRAWPAHLPRSRDFPELPLVRVAPVEDLGRTGGDMDVLTRALEQELRRVRLLRLSSDEEAVPGWLRDGEPPARGDEHRKPGLVLEGWTDRAGRLVLELEDLVTDDTLARVRSR